MIELSVRSMPQNAECLKFAPRPQTANWFKSAQQFGSNCSTLLSEVLSTWVCKCSALDPPGAQQLRRKCSTLRA